MITKYKIISNMFWRFAERIGAQFVQFIVQIVLARILLPEIYGTVALMTAFITILEVFVDSGLGNALIQKKNSDDKDFSTVFYFNIFICFIIYILLFIFAPVIAKFYNNFALTNYIRVLGLTIVISGVKNVQQAYVSKNLMFKKFFYATISGTIIAGVVGIYMALNGFGVWALIAQQLINMFIDTVILWITVKWRPIRSFSFKRLKELWTYGWKLLVSSLISTGYEELRQLIIGKKYSSADLAYYNNGEKFPKVIISNINNSIDSVLLPTMSEEQENKERVKSMTRRSITVGIFIMAPLMMGLIAVSSNLVKLVLTEKWLESVPYLCIFCITYMFYPIHTANLNAIKALGRSDLFLKLEIIKKIVGLTVILITMNISVWAMCLSLIFTSILGQIVNSWPNRKILNYSYLEQLKDILPSIFIAIIMGAIVYFMNFIPISNIFILLTLQVLLGGIIYIGLSKLFKIDSFEYLLNIIYSKLKRKKNGE